MAEFREKGPRGPVEHQKVPTRAAVFVPVFKQRAEADGRGTPGLEAVRRSDEARLAEAIGLAAAIDLDIVASAIVTGQKPQPAALLGSGKIGVGRGHRKSLSEPEVQRRGGR